MTPHDVRDDAIAAMALAYYPVPGQRVIDRPDWFQVITPSIRHGSLNGVERSIVRDDAQIDAAIDDYRSIGCKFRWTVPPGSAPDDLGDRLERRGLERREIVQLVRATREPFHAVPGVTVERVTDATVDTFAELMAFAWGGEAHELRALYRAAAAHQLMFLARVDGEPAGAAAMNTFARISYLRGGVVLPKFRGRGAYRALVAARAAATDREFVTSASNPETSAPILARMGFVEVARYRAYRG
ncbi:MAG TPA: GNAT family N-acetyltransferase [Kofleriaceae bacterium]